jgi:hypothetical protein
LLLSLHTSNINSKEEEEEEEEDKMLKDKSFSFGYKTQMQGGLNQNSLITLLN